MRRYIELSATLGTIFIVQNFDSIVGMTGGQNSTNIPYEIYQVFYSAKDYGAASALGVVVVFGSIIVATFGLRVVSSLLSEEIGLMTITLPDTPAGTPPSHRYPDPGRQAPQLRRPSPSG